MEVSVQKQLFEEICGYIRGNTTALADSAMPYPAKAYYDPDHHQRERRMLERFPLIAGNSAEVAKAGDYICGEILGTSYVIVRQKDGSLKAFRNVCSHRGSPVVTKCEGNASQFVCPYHAWSFNLDGSLRAIYRPGFPDVDRGGLGMPALGVAERHGLIWLRLDGGEVDVETLLGGIDGELASFRLGEYALERREIFEAEINWKSVLDGFLETYHFAPLHSDSIGPYFYSNLSAYTKFGLNGRMVGIRKSFDTLLDSAFKEGEILTHIASNYQIFPNTVIVWQGDHFETWTSFPGETPDRCRVIFMMLVPEETREAHAKRWQRNMDIIKATVMNEDWRMSQDVQKVLPKIRNEEILFGANEPALQHFYGELARELAEMN